MPSWSWRAVRTVAVVVGVVTLSLAGSGPAPVFLGTRTMIRGSAETGRTLSVVALGDSVTSGYACGCTAFPVLYGRALAKRTGATVSVENDGVNGLTTAGVISQLAGSPVRPQVAGADVVLVTIGANDFTDHEDDVTGGSCESAGSDCVSDELSTMRQNLARILATIASVRHGRATTVLVTGYWNVFEDGAVADHDYGTKGRQATVALTERVNAAIQEETASAHDTYVDLFAPFQAYGDRITTLLAPDGDHPDAAGHALIARLLERAGLPAARS